MMECSDSKRGGEAKTNLWWIIVRQSYRMSERAILDMSNRDCVVWAKRYGNAMMSRTSESGGQW